LTRGDQYGYKQGVLKSSIQRLLFAVLVVILLFSGVLPPLATLQTSAFAEESSSEQNNSGDEDPGETNPPIATPKIRDLSITLKDSNTELAFSSNPGVEPLIDLTIKGGSIQFDSIVYWDDWKSENRNWYGVTWSVNDPSIASMSNNGILTAKGDGTVKVSAKVPGVNTAGGGDLIASVLVKIGGQTDSRYVTGIRIADENGADLRGEPFVWEPDLTKDTYQFNALIDVHDPKTGQTTTYSTADGSFASQASDISPLRWFVEDTIISAVDDKTGLFRPLKYSTSYLYVASEAGFSNNYVMANIVVSSKNPSGLDPEGYFPQSSLTVKAYYELYTPEEYGNDAYVIDETYSLGEIEAMGTFTQTYTVLGGDIGYFTMTGQGVPFATLLSNAGVNLAGVQRFEFSTADAERYAQTVSKAFIFDRNRYYYPNIDINRYNGAKQVYPMIAINSNQKSGGNTDPNYDMSEATRFRLLFGSTQGVSNSQYQIKWINTIYVVLEGGPSVSDGDGSGDPGDGSGQGGGSGNRPGDGSGSSEQGLGADGGQAGNPEQGKYGAVLEADKNEKQTKASEGEAGSVNTQSENTARGMNSDGSLSNDSQGKPEQKFSIYQVMNRNDSNTKKALDFENPFKRAVVPLGAAVFAAGGANALLWYRRQIRMFGSI